MWYCVLKKKLRVKIEKCIDGLRREGGREERRGRERMRMIETRLLSRKTNHTRVEKNQTGLRPPLATFSTSSIQGEQHQQGVWKKRMAHEYYTHSPLKLASRYSPTWKNLGEGAHRGSPWRSHLTVKSSQLIKTQEGEIVVEEWEDWFS